jgi:Ca2+-binding EF-hand superfamily protein
MRIHRVISLLLAGFFGVAATGVAMAQRETSGYDDEGSRSGQWSNQDDRLRPQQQQQQQQRSTSARSRRENQQEVQRFIQRFDENGDRRLSRQELPERLEQQFSQLDRNNDSRLSASELERHSQRMAAQPIPVEITYIWITDAHRGRMNVNDLQQAYQLLQRIDEDNNGQLTRSEIQDRREEVVAQWINSMMERTDQNGDRAISQREAQDTLLSRSFNRVDRDGDGQLSRNELRRIASQDSRESFVREEDRQREQARQSDESQRY